MSQPAESLSFLDDGLDRWWQGVEAAVRAAVIAEYEDRLRGPSWLSRLRLALAIEREVERRLKDVDPPSPESLF